MRVAFCFISLFLVHCPNPVASVDCSQYKQEWYRLRYTSTGVNILNQVSPDTAYLGGVCPVSQSPSCCDRRTEQEMFTVAQRFVSHQLEVNWGVVAQHMGNDSSTLETYLRGNVEETRDRSHEFFSRIYGYNYKAHKRFFLQFFSDLEAYVMGRQNQLSQLIDNFFSQLRDSIVALIERSGQTRSNAGYFNQQPVDNANPSVDEAAEAERIRCLSDRVAKLHPFDDVDVRLKSRMMEAYPPARMLVHTLLVGNRLIFRLMNQIIARPECVVGLARHQLCAVCAGRSLASVCPESCPKLMSSCLFARHSGDLELGVIWPRLIDSILLASVRLERSFNFPAVNRHLQMEISEAITSLQTRYEQTKSKFESECRIGPSGRTAPTLFSSSNAAANRPASTGNQPSPSHFPTWPHSGFGRQKRSAAQQFDRYQASPDLLEWQTRPRVPMADPFQPMSANYAPSAPASSYGSVGDQLSEPSWNMALQPGARNKPDSLAQLTARIKQTYAPLKHLFSDPVAAFCPSSNATVNSTECWNPPDLTNPKTDESIIETLRLLSDAATRLTRAATESADPDVLPAMVADATQPAAALRSSKILNARFPSGTKDSVRAAAAQHNTWDGPPKQEPFSPYGSPIDRNEFPAFGSGAGGESWEQFPQPYPQPVNQPSEFIPPQQQHFPPPTVQPQPPPDFQFPDDKLPGGVLQGSGDGDFQPPPSVDEYQWPPGGDNADIRTEPSHVSSLPDSRQLAANSTESVAATTQSTTSTSPTVAVTKIKVAATTTSTTTTTAELKQFSPTSSTPVYTTTRATTTTRHYPTPPQSTKSIQLEVTRSTVGVYPETLPSSSRPPSTVHVTSSVASKTTTVRSTTTTPESSTAPPSPVDGSSFNKPQPPSVINGFPDDEDTVSQTGPGDFNQPISPNRQPPWTGMHAPLRQQETWIEQPRVQPDQSQSQPFGVHGPVQPLPPQPPTSGFPPYYGPGSGQMPEPEASYPERQPDLYFPGGPQPESVGYSDWAQRPKPHHVPENSGLFDGDSAMWPGQGSGVYVESSTPAYPYVDQASIPFTDPMREATPSSLPTTEMHPVINHLVLPPPEIWVPAQIGPGHRLPSVMLVREYNMQDPFSQSATFPRISNLAHFGKHHHSISLLCILLSCCIFL